MRVSVRRTVGALLAVTMVAGYTTAQDTQRELDQSQQLQQRQTQQRQVQAGQEGQASQLDQYLAQWLIVKNQAEVDISRMGQQHAEAAEVKDFASKMVQEHQQLVHELEQIAGKVGQRHDPTAAQQQTGQQRSQSLQQTPTSTGEESAQQLVQLIGQVEMQMAEKLKEALQKTEGAQFDRSFMSLQLLAHMSMLETLKVTKSQASSQLQQTIEQAEQSMQQHLEEAQQIHQQLDEGSSASRPRSEAQVRD